MNDQITNYLVEHTILDEYQSGFRPGFSTKTALSRIVDDIRNALDKHGLVIIVLFDFSKSFDTLD